MKIVESKPITHVEAEDVLTKLETEKKQLGYEQKITLDYLRAHKTASKKDIKDAIESLSKIEGLKDHQVISIVNLMPKDEDEVNAIFMKERVKLEKDRIPKILAVIDSIRPKEKKKEK